MADSAISRTKPCDVVHSRSFVERSDPPVSRDPVRSADLGFHLGKETLRLLKGAVRMDFFSRLSDARLGEELRLLLGESAAHKAVARLAELDLLRFLHPAVAWSPKLDGLLQAIDEVLGVVSAGLPALARPRHTAGEHSGAPQGWD